MSKKDIMLKQKFVKKIDLLFRGIGVSVSIPLTLIIVLVWISLFINAKIAGVILMISLAVYVITLLIFGVYIIKWLKKDINV